MDLGHEEGFAPSRVAVLLKEFAQLDDEREPWRVVYPLAEVLLVTCATVASCDDFDDIVAFGKHDLHDLRRYAPFHHGIPCAPGIRALVNRIDPALFAACFESWINARLVLGQRSVPEKADEITAIPDLLDHLAEAGHLEGALVTVDAMGTQVEIAARIVGHGADCLLPLKGDQPTLEADVEDGFRTAPASEIITKTTIEKARGRIETRFARRRLDRVGRVQGLPATLDLDHVRRHGAPVRVSQGSAAAGRPDRAVDTTIGLRAPGPNGGFAGGVVRHIDAKDVASATVTRLLSTAKATGSACASETHVMGSAAPPSC